MERLGLIAGNGDLPIQLAKILRKENRFVLAVAHHGETRSELEGHVDRCMWIDVGQFGRMIDILKEQGIRQAVMIGGIDKKRIFARAKPDERALRVIERLRARGDNEILTAMAAELEAEGIRIENSHSHFRSFLVGPGPLTAKVPTPQQERDIALGFEVLHRVGSLDIGQSIVVKEGVVLAVEAIEGTDEAIRRGGRLGGPGAVVVKGSKPTQDLRFDCPVVGLGTIRTMAEVEAEVLAVEAGRTLFVEREEAVQEAVRRGIAIFAR